MAAIADTRPLSSLVVYSSTAEIIIAISFFIIASIFESLDDSKISKPCLKLKKFQLAATGIVLALSAVHTGLLAYPSVFVSGETDPIIACALFFILTWVITLLPLIDRKSDAAYPHYVTWSVILVFETLNTLLILWPSDVRSTTKYWADVAVLISRLVSMIILLAGSTIVKYAYSKGEDATPEETQPLLDVESTTANQATADKKDKNDEEEEENEANKWDEEEEEAWKEDLETLKKRSWKGYLSSFKIFLPHLRPRTKTQYTCLMIMLACTAFERVLNVFTPLSLGWVVNHFQGATSMPWRALAQYLGLYFINSSAGLSAIESLATMRMSMSMRVSLDIFIYNHVMNLDAKFHDSKQTTSLGRIADRGDAVVELFQEFFFEFMPTIADLLISLAVLQWLFGAYVSFIVAITGVLFAWSNAMLIKHRTALRRKYIDAWSAVYEHMFETQYNWTTVSHFGRIEHEKDNFKAKNNGKMSKEMELMVYSEVTRCTRQLIVTGGFICATLLASNQIIRGHRNIGDFVMLVSYWSQVMAPVRSIIGTITSVSERLVDAEKLMLVMEKVPDVKNKPDAPKFDFQGGSVDFENVTFSYDGERTVSEGITFHADAGQTIALVGETGGGKSTLLKLLFRFYDPTSGRILIDGQDLKDVDLESFRQLIGIVPQDPAMFNRTILANVRYPDSDATEADVIEACKAACLHDKIMTFAKQYKEKVGENGTKLSGGECQRLAIARAILKKPKMLLLDEATSSVDSVTESKIQACLKELCKGHTTFIIAHRLSTILHADQIMVIKGGKLMEMGPHRKLIKMKGAYRELWDAQLNLQAQGPDDTDEDGDKEDGENGAKKEKKPNLFFNDMGKEKIDEAMLLATYDSEDDTAHPPGSSSQQSKADIEITEEDVTVSNSSDGETKH